MAHLRGIDISHHQGSVDLAKADRAGFDFCAIRWGVGTNADTRRVENLRKLRDTSMIPMIYGVVPARSNPSVAAKWLVDDVDRFTDWKGIVPVLDAETVKTKFGSFDPSRDAVVTYKDTLERLLGTTPLSYIPRWWMEKMHWTAGLGDCEWWPSRYIDPPWGDARLEAHRPAAFLNLRRPRLWQFTSSGTVAGIAGRCDVNVWFDSAAALAALAKGGGDMPITDQDVEKIKTGVRQVLNEGTGTGSRSWADTNKAILGTVQHLVNVAGSTQSALGSAIGDSKSAVLGAIAALPPPDEVELDQEDIEHLAAKILAKLSAAGIALPTRDEVVEALRTDVVRTPEE